MKLDPRQHVSVLDSVSLLVTFPGLGSFISWFDDVFNSNCFLYCANSCKLLEHYLLFVNFIFVSLLCWVAAF